MRKYSIKIEVPSIDARDEYLRVDFPLRRDAFRGLVLERRCFSKMHFNAHGRLLISLVSSLLVSVSIGLIVPSIFGFEMSSANIYFAALLLTILTALSYSVLKSVPGFFVVLLAIGIVVPFVSWLGTVFIIKGPIVLSVIIVGSVAFLYCLTRTIYYSKFFKIKLNNFDFSNTFIDRCEFYRVDLSGSSFDGAEIINTTFDRTIIDSGRIYFLPRSYADGLYSQDVKIIKPAKRKK